MKICPFAVSDEMPSTVEMAMKEPDDTANDYPLVDVLSGSNEVDNKNPQIQQPSPPAPNLTSDTLCDNSRKNPRRKVRDAPKLEYTKSNALHTKVGDADRENGGRIACDICGKLFSTRRKLQQHRVTDSCGVRFECFKCKKKFSTHSEAEAHSKCCLQAEDIDFVAKIARMERLESLENMLTCKNCNRSYSRKDQYNHRECQYCGISGLSDLDLQRSMIEHSYAQVQASGSHAGDLIAHKGPAVRRKKKREPIVKNHTCRQCGDQFTTQFWLRSFEAALHHDLSELNQHSIHIFISAGCT